MHYAFLMNFSSRGTLGNVNQYSNLRDYNLRILIATIFAKMFCKSRIHRRISGAFQAATKTHATHHGHIAIQVDPRLIYHDLRRDCGAYLSHLALGVREGLNYS